MIVLKSWLKDYIAINLSDQELCDQLTFAGNLVDTFVQTLDHNIVVAEIKSISPHGNADRLRVAIVTDGEQDYKIVCGAPNIEVGMRVPLAKIGAKIGEVVISEANIRGEDSFGMLCSERELGLGDNHEGILAISSDAPLGAPISDLFGSDLIMDLEITPNRGDCLSHLGIAREIAAITRQTLAKPPLSLKMSGETAKSALSVNVKDTNLCPNYFARIVRNVKIGPSPEWLQKRLTACGLKPINNVVDITNYIMLDLGQPLHAFDASKITGNQIVVRKAKSGEQIVTLDGENRTLSSDAIVIADSDKPMAIAGVMGGYDSQILDTTTDVVLEAAEFNRVSIRKTSKTLGLSTDASYRFERGIDPSTIEYALNKAAKMLHEIAGGTVLTGIVSQSTSKTIQTVEYKTSKINELLGTDFNDNDISHYLKLLGFKTSIAKVEVPSWRHDVSIWQDLAEEVMRLYGLDSIKMQPVAKSEAPKYSPYYYKEYLKDVLVAAGFTETYNYSFMSEDDIKIAGLLARDLLEIANPISPENRYMRNSLIPGMMKTIAKNPAFDPVLVFELGNVFDKTAETAKLCVTAAGSSADKNIQKAIKSIDAALPLSTVEKEPKLLTKEELAKYKIKKSAVWYVEIDLTNIQKRMKVETKKLALKLDKKEIHYRPVSKYPSVARDLAFILDAKIDADDVKSAIYNVSDLINSVELFDEFASEKFGKGNKNIAFHLMLQASDRTLKDEEANQIIKQIISIVQNSYKAQFRDK